MAGTRKVTVEVYLSDEDEKKAEILKGLMAKYIDESLCDASIGEVVAKALSYKTREVLNEKLKDYEWIEDFARRHPDMPIEKKKPGGRFLKGLETQEQGRK